MSGRLPVAKPFAKQPRICPECKTELRPGQVHSGGFIQAVGHGRSFVKPIGPKPRRWVERTYDPGLCSDPSASKYLRNEPYYYRPVPDPTGAVRRHGTWIPPHVDQDVRWEAVRDPRSGARICPADLGGILRIVESMADVDAHDGSHGPLDHRRDEVLLGIWHDLFEHYANGRRPPKRAVLELLYPPEEGFRVRKIDGELVIDERDPGTRGRYRRVYPPLEEPSELPPWVKLGRSQPREPDYEALVDQPVTRRKP